MAVPYSNPLKTATGYKPAMKSAVNLKIGSINSTLKFKDTLEVAKRVFRFDPGNQ